METYNFHNKSSNSGIPPLYGGMKLQTIQSNNASKGGIKNLGATCYINLILQAMSTHRSVLDHLFVHSQRCRKPEKCISCKLIKLFIQL